VETTLMLHAVNWPTSIKARKKALKKRVPQFEAPFFGIKL
jgi:hypothetical protein